MLEVCKKGMFEGLLQKWYIVDLDRLAWVEVSKQVHISPGIWLDIDCYCNFIVAVIYCEMINTLTQTAPGFQISSRLHSYLGCSLPHCERQTHRSTQGKRWGCANIEKIVLTHTVLPVTDSDVCPTDLWPVGGSTTLEKAVKAADCLLVDVDVNNAAG